MKSQNPECWGAGRLFLKRIKNRQSSKSDYLSISVCDVIEQCQPTDLVQLCCQ